MPDGLFSDFLMADLDPRGPNARQSKRAHAGAGPVSMSDYPRKDVQKKLTEVLSEALADNGVSPARSRIEPAALVEALTDIAVGRSVVLRLNPAGSGPDREAVRVFLEGLVQMAGTLAAGRQEAAIAKLADILLPDPLAGARGALAKDNLELRDRFIAQASPLTSAEVGRRAGNRTRNPYATAARWKKAGKVFSVHHRGAEYFPAFQFRDGRPHPTVKQVLAVLPQSASPWQRAFWFVSTNGWLDGKTPADLLDDTDAVVAAARQEALDVIG